MKIDLTKNVRMKNGWKVRNLYVNGYNVICGQFYNDFLKNWYPHFWTLAGKSNHQQEFDLVNYEEVDVTDNKTDVGK